MIKKIYENPTISDTIEFEITTPDFSGCFSSNPYKVDQVIIFFIERSFGSSNNQQYKNLIHDNEKTNAALEAEAIACSNPTPENVIEAKKLRNIANSNISSNTVNFSKSIPVKVFGNKDYPAWLSTDVPNSTITNIAEDFNGNSLYGHYSLIWEPKGEYREGDYILCWTWTMHPSGEKQSLYLPFALQGNTQITTSIPSHYTNPQKYDTLLEHYLPEMYKNYLTGSDLTPEVLTKLNKAIAKGFTQLENLSNQLIDLYDSNAVHESILPYLSNMFSLKLRSNDPILWRRQIKEAVPLFKKKGTYAGLKSALEQTGVEVKKFTQLWQTSSPYTWIDSFKVTDQLEFELSKIALPYDVNNFELSIRYSDSNNYEELSNDYVSFETNDGVTTMTWEGMTHSTPIFLSSGDILRVLYKYKNIPDNTEQLIEDYIRSLPFADLRDERNQTHPLKNWNIRVIEDDDPLFNIIIKDRHPFNDDIIFGHIRTEFAYSENIYNMEEYNNSTRPSTNPCDISKEFVDDCRSCISSKFVIDVEIQDMSNDKIVETFQVIEEYSPFHAILHSLNAVGVVSEFVQSPTEEITCLIKYKAEDYVISGNANYLFHRIMNNPNSNELIKRVLLANGQTVISDQIGIGHNDSIVLYCPEVDFSKQPINQSNVLEIFSPSANAGTYSVSNPIKNTVEISTNRINNSNAFTFRLSNNIYFNPSASIAQKDIKCLGGEDFLALPMKTQWNVENSNYNGLPWTATLTYGTFNVLDINQEGDLVLHDPYNALPTSNINNLVFDLKNETGQIKLESNKGKLKVKRRAKVTINDVGLPNLRLLIKKNDYLVYNNIQYKITGFLNNSNNEFYIENYGLGNATGVPVYIYRRLVNNQVGYLDYKGIKLQTFSNLEQNLNIQNGVNNPGINNQLESNQFKENFLVVIEDEYFQIAEIDGNNITLSGPLKNWGTLLNGGTAVSYYILKFTKEEINIGDNYIEYIDRRGNESSQAVQRDIISTSFNYIMSGGVDSSGTAINAGVASESLGPSSNSDEINDKVDQNESIYFTIQYKDGKISEGSI